MKKIIVGFLSIVMTISATAGVAYASLNSTVPINNVTFSLANAPTLSISTTGVSDSFTASADFIATPLTDLIPGQTQIINVWLKNDATSPVSLALSAQLVSASNDWANLSQLISVQYGASGPSGTLAQWNANPVGLGLTLAPGQTEEVPITISVSPSADNSVAGHTVTTNWVLTGTQTP